MGILIIIDIMFVAFPGYVYLTFECEKSVKALLMRCVSDPLDTSQYYYKVSSRRMKEKEVQIIPWALSDSNSICCPSPRLDPSRTVFVGGLHGLINAGESLLSQCSVYLHVCVKFSIFRPRTMGYTYFLKLANI